MSRNLFAEFVSLSPASTEDSFNALSIHQSRRDFLGKTRDGGPVFLITDSRTQNYRPEIRHQYLRVSFGTSCRLIVEGKELISQFAVIRFEQGAVEMHELFIRCVYAATLSLPESADTRVIEERINRLLMLFQALSTPSNRELSGLWAELFCIRHSTNPTQALSYWHSNPTETYDFAWNGNRTEVKSTTTSNRIHEFSLDQLTPPLNGQGKVISLMLRYSNDGVGVMDLARQIEIDLKERTDLREKLWSQILQSLGRDFCDDLDRKFDTDFTLKNIVIFAMQDIPTIVPPLDQRISSIRFKVDLSGVYVKNSGKGIVALRAAFK